jgi:DNA-binding response OmpR family regulator
MAVPAVLVVTKDPSVQQLVERALGHAAYEVVSVPDAEAGIRTTLAVRLSAVVLDSGVGFEELEALADLVRSREEATFGLVFLTSARTRPASLPIEPERDEVVVKPFTPEQVRLAVERVTRAAERSRSDTLLIGHLELDRATYELRDDAAAVILSPTEFRLMEYLAQHQGRWVSSEELAEKVWERKAGSKSAGLVRSHVQNLRAKLRALPRGAELLQTWARRGYRLG